MLENKERSAAGQDFLMVSRQGLSASAVAAPLVAGTKAQPFAKVEQLIEALNDAVLELAERPALRVGAGVDEVTVENARALEWIRVTLEDVSATCAGIQLHTREEPVPRLQIVT